MQYHIETPILTLVILSTGQPITSTGMKTDQVALHHE